MGKLAVISDLHVDINGLNQVALERMADYLVKEDVTHLHFAGDVANTAAKTLETVEQFQQFLPTTFHWGNHEMVTLIGENEIEAYPHEDFLSFRSYPLSDEVLLVGVNGWYDYQFAENPDLKKNQRLKNLYWYDRKILRAGNDPMISQRINQRLDEFLGQLPKEKTIILSTHFVPKTEFIIQHQGEHVRWNQLNAFLGSPGFGEVIDKYPQVGHVIFGHTHRRFEPKKIKQTWYHCRPFGYYYEWQTTRTFVFEHQLVEKYRPNKLRSVLRDNRALYHVHKEKNLLKELQEGMTIIHY